MLKRFPLVILAVLALFFVARDCQAQELPPPVPAGEVVYVSTGTGGQVLKIDATRSTTGPVQVISTPSCNENLLCDLEGMVVGPDGKIYVADPNDGDIFRLDQNGANFETVFGSPSCEGDGPCAPQAPAFSGTAARDLYFSDPRNGNIWTIAGAGAVLLNGSFATPSSTFYCDCSLGQGLAFDASDNLVFNNNSVDIDSLAQPSYSVESFAGNGPSGAIALNPITGEIFIAEPSTGRIQEGLLDGAPTYYSFNTSDSGDTPFYMGFDGTGHLFVVTMQLPVEGQPNSGKVWRIEPGGATAVEIADLGALYGAEGHSGLNSDNAVGVALPATQGETQSTSVSSAAGSFNFSWPVGCPTVASPCLYTFGVQYPAGMFPDGGTAVVTPNETTEADWAGRTPPGNPFNGTQIAPVAGENGSGIIFSAQCVLNNAPCPVPNPSLSYTISTTWKSSQSSYCTLGPGLLKADPIGSDNWANTLTGCTIVSPDPTYGTKGKTTCTSSSCLSDWANVFGVTYTFVGFSSPVSNAPTFNVAKAGQAIPIKFQVLGANGNPVANLTMPPVSMTLVAVACPSASAPTTSLPPDVASAGNSGFQNLGGGNYQFVWKTSKAMAGCWQLQVSLGDLDGTGAPIVYSANFQFK